MDIFGKGVHFFYKGKREFKTKWGCFVTTCVITSLFIILVIKLIEFFGETDPIAYLSETRQNMHEPINLNDLGFTFAVENIEPKIGQIEAYQYHWDSFDGIKRKTPIKLLPCDKLEPWGIDIANSYS